MMAVTCAGLMASGASYRAVAFTSAVASSAVSAVGPRIEFDSTVLDFGEVTAGKIVEHNFVFTNTGDQVLEIQDVRPTCGCTMAGAWDRLIKPGHVGVVPIRYNSANSDGDVFKTVIVLCNDPSRTNVVLQIKGAIWKPIEVKPAYVEFGASVDCQTNQTRVVHIVSNMQKPVAIFRPECANRSFQTSLKTVRPGKEFELQITLVPPLTPGNLTVPISLRTSSLDQPVINVFALAVVQAPVSASPPRITLAPGPLSTAMTINVTIENNRARPLVLSEPDANIAGMEVRLREIEPGRQFVLTANFPAGFQIKAGRNVLIQMKTNDPQFPTFEVPVIQNQHLAAILKLPAENPLKWQ